MGCLTTVSALGAALILASAGQDGQLLIGTDESFPPYVMADTSGALTGFEIDVMNEICARTANDCDFRVATFDELLPGVSSGRFDAVIGGIAITPERRALVDFTQAYTNGGEVEWFVGPPGAPEPEGARIAVQSGTIHADWLRAQGYNHTGYSSEAGALGAVASGAADLALGPFSDRPDLAPMIDGNGFQFLYQVEIPDEGTGIAVCRGNDDLRAQFDAAIAAMWADGTLDALEKRWF